jgi:hypothetical protein
VITVYGGKTVEVLNTDAEGRLVMADAIVRAGEDDPDLIVDVATLTGAQLVALGTRTAGVMANDDTVRDRVVAAAGRAGEAAWPMPLPEELRKGLDSTGGRALGAPRHRGSGLPPGRAVRLHTEGRDGRRRPHPRADRGGRRRRRTLGGPRRVVTRVTGRHVSGPCHRPVATSGKMRPGRTIAPCAGARVSIEGASRVE